MDKEEIKELTKVLNSINSKLDILIAQTAKEVKKQMEFTDSDELKNRSLLNSLLHICTHPNFDDKQYTNALRQISELPFGLSAKQISWVLMYTPRHSECGEQIEAFIEKQFSKQKNLTEYKEQIYSELRTKYANDNNSGFVEKLIERIDEI